MSEHLRIHATTQVHQEARRTHADHTVDGNPQDLQRQLNGSQAPTQPPHSRWQRHRQVTHRRGCHLYAGRVGDDCDSLLDVGKQARQACGHEVR